MDTERKFTRYVLEYTTLKTNFDQNDKLYLYGLYKQATIGDINIEVPSIFIKVFQSYRQMIMDSFSHFNIVRQMIFVCSRLSEEVFFSLDY
jgi:hypothetical protein